MSLCNSDCAPVMPLGYGGGCKITLKPAGIRLFGVISCSEDAPNLDFTQQSTWTTLCTSGKLAVSGEILGEKPKGSFTKKKIASCIPDVTTGGTKTLNIQDYGADANGGVGEYDFWNTILADPTSYYGFFITCDDKMYLIPSKMSIELDEVVPNTSEESKYIDISISWLQKLMCVWVNSIRRVCI